MLCFEGASSRCCVVNLKLSALTGLDETLYKVLYRGTFFGVSMPLASCFNIVNGREGLETR